MRSVLDLTPTVAAERACFSVLFSFIKSAILTRRSSEEPSLGPLLLAFSLSSRLLFKSFIVLFLSRKVSFRTFTCVLSETSSWFFSSTIFSLSFALKSFASSAATALAWATSRAILALVMLPAEVRSCSAE